MSIQDIFFFTETYLVDMVTFFAWIYLFVKIIDKRLELSGTCVSGILLNCSGKTFVVKDFFSLLTR